MRSGPEADAPATDAAGATNDPGSVAAPDRRAADADAFRRAAGALTSGVTVVCAVLDGRLYGTTVAAVAPVSDDPPSILACMNEASSTREAVVRAGAFTVNVLAEDQAWLARQFAGRGDKFAGVDNVPCEETGAPLIAGALASFSCTLSDSTVVGTHTVLFGSAVASSVTEANPLTYFGGSFGRWERLREHHAYEQVRRVVLQRDVPVGELLDAAELAARLDARADDVHNALVKLSMDGLVDRRSDGYFTPAPIGIDLIESIYDARANIEIGVVANHVGRVPDDVLRRLEGIVDGMEALAASPDGDRRSFLALHTDLHLALIRLSGSAQLLDSYRRLSIAWAWRSIWEERDWRAFPGREALRELLPALAAGDLTGSIRAIQRYHEAARDVARAAVAARGTL